jgi:hypothetical protein
MALLAAPSLFMHDPGYPAVAFPVERENRPMLRIGSSISLLILLCSAANAVTLLPTADSYVRDGASYAGVNNGASKTLYVKSSATAGYNRATYVKFSLPSLSGVTSAKLRIYAALTASDSLVTSACTVADTSWTEGGITWNNRPLLGAAAGSTTISGSAYAWYTIDVTAYVLSQIAAGHPQISLALKNGSTASSSVVQVYSREAASSQPALDITLGGTTTGTAPAAPGNLTATSVSGGQINLNWTDNSSSEDGFQVERATGGAFARIATVGANGTSYASTGLTAGTGYNYRVRAINSAGVSAYSNTAGATTGTTPPPPPPPSSGAKYVSLSGSDGASGSQSSPWRTLKHALAALQPGDTLLVRGGTYLERVTGIGIHPGTAGSPIVVAAYPGERPILQGLLWLTNPSYWTFDGLNVTWDSATGSSSEHMIKLTNGVGWTFKNAEVWGAHSFAGMLVAGTVSGQPSNWRVANCCFHDTYPSNSTNQDHLIYANTGLSAGPGIIERNVMYNAVNGEGVKLAGPNSGGGTVNVTVRYNTIFNTSQSILIAWQSHDNQVVHNLLYQTNPNNGCIRGYQLTGSNNVASNNAGGGAAGLFRNDGSGVRDGGGNVFPINPLFDFVGPRGLHPQNSACQAYGAYAP